MSVSHIMFDALFLPPSILEKVLAEAWGGRDWTAEKMRVELRLCS